MSRGLASCECGGAALRLGVGEAGERRHEVDGARHCLAGPTAGTFGMDHDHRHVCLLLVGQRALAAEPPCEPPSSPWSAVRTTALQIERGSVGVATLDIPRPSSAAGTYNLASDGAGGTLITHS